MLQPNKKKNKDTWKEDKEFLNNWYANRKLPNPQLNKDYQDEKQLYMDAAKKLAAPNFVNQIDEFNTQGIYDQKTGNIDILNTADPLVYTHEGTHGINIPLKDTKSSMNAFLNIGKNVLPQDQIQNQWVKDNYKEISNYQEVIGRLNAYRQLHGLQPDQEITPELIKANRDAYNKGEIEFEDNADQLYKLFDDKGLSETLNSVVSNTKQQDPEVQYAELGGIIKSTMAKKKRNKKLPSYELGSYVTNPSQDLYENQIAIARASQKAGDNPWVKGLDMFGNLAMQYGTSMMNSPEGGKAYNGGDATSTGFTGFLNKNSGSIVQGTNTAGGLSQMFALGGTANQAPITAEGGEVMQTPMGNPVELQGPSHANGGIDMVVPVGTEIYSKKLKGPDGKTMADRKKIREKSQVNIDKLLEKSPTDKILKGTADKIKTNNELQEQNDMKTMQLAQMFDQLQSHFANGGTVGPDPYRFPKPALPEQEYQYPSMFNNFSTNTPYLPTNESLGIPNTQFQEGTFTPPAEGTKTSGQGLFSKIGNVVGGSDISLGDAIGLYGQYKSTFDPMKNTQANRAGDTPNINPYENFGKEALAKMDQSKQYVNQIRDEQLGDLQLSQNADINRGRNSARSVNTMRALDIASTLGANENRSNIYNQFAQAMQQILSQEAGLENTQDQMVMSGRATQDAADRADRDNYFSQMAKDIATRGTGIQQIGKTVNDMKERKVTGNIMNQLYANFGIDTMTGNIKAKATQEVNQAPNFYKDIPKETADRIFAGLGSTYIRKGDKLYDAKGNELDKITLKIK